MSGHILQHDALGMGGRYWSTDAGHGSAGQVLLQRAQQPTMPPTPFQRLWPMEEQLEMLSRKFHACLLQLIRQGFSETEARLSLLRNRFDADAAATELYHAAFVRKLRRASQTRAELGYSRPDVYRCGYKFLHKYQPCLQGINESAYDDEATKSA